MQKAAIIIAFFTLLAGWQLFSLTNNQPSNLTLDPPATVPFVDINKYVGLWYEQASIPQIFQ
jgi:lipocalin